jgi:hypothetical protein
MYNAKVKRGLHVKLLSNAITICPVLSDCSSLSCILAPLNRLHRLRMLLVKDDCVTILFRQAVQSLGYPCQATKSQIIRNGGLHPWLNSKIIHSFSTVGLKSKS